MVTGGECAGSVLRGQMENGTERRGHWHTGSKFAMSGADRKQEDKAESAETKTRTCETCGHVYVLPGRFNVGWYYDFGARYSESEDSASDVETTSSTSSDS